VSTAAVADPITPRRRIRSVVTGALAVLGSGVLLAGCSLPPKVAVAPSDRGAGIRILRARCSDWPVDAFSLQTLGRDGYAQTHDDRVLWKVVANRDRRIGSVVVGQVPPGFHETVPLRARPRVDAELVAVVHQDSFGDDVGFRIEQLRRGRVFYWHNETRADFDEQACRGTGPTAAFWYFVACAVVALCVVVGLLHRSHRRRARVAPAGWYVDPSDPSAWRWWDGARWADPPADDPDP
jgi:hypothetical protein